MKNELQVINLADWQQYVVEAAQRGAMGEQLLFRFENNYGASVIRGPYTYGGNAGLFELCVIEWHSNTKYELTYSTPVADDVIGWLTGDEVLAKLSEIQALPKV